MIQWCDDRGVLLSLHYFPVRPNLEAGLDELDALRLAARRALDAQGAGLVELEPTLLGNLPAIRQIVKFHSAEGNAYVGSVILPFADRSYVVKVQSAEHGATGMREAAVMDERLRSDDFDGDA